MPVYPRWRGEHDFWSAVSCVLDGLSPLARGTHTNEFAKLTPSRFIPAGAGNTINKKSDTQGAAVYPRWRGEHNNLYEKNGCRFGLSPLARGTLQKNNDGSVDTRFIPAGAGNTLIGRAKTLELAVYPRWRGEHIPMRC